MEDKAKAAVLAFVVELELHQGLLQKIAEKSHWIGNGVVGFSKSAEKDGVEL